MKKIISRILWTVGFTAIAFLPLGVYLLVEKMISPTGFWQKFAVAGLGLTSKQTARSRNMWALGLVLWLYDRDRQTTTDWIRKKFRDEPVIAEANVAVLNAGHAFGETAEFPNFLRPVAIGPAPVDPGMYRTVSGTEAVAWGLVALGMRRLN